MAKTKAIVILSLAYSGTTWLTLVLGSHKEAFCLGAGDRLFQAGPTNGHGLCQIHGPTCDFWPRFFTTYDPTQRFLPQLARFTGKSTFVINNPSMDLMKREFSRGDLDLKVIKLVRDGRAALASAMRHHPHRVKSVYQSALAWLYRGTRNLERRIERLDVKPLMIRYEDAVADPPATLRTVGDFTGLAYDSSSLRYWEFEHHLATGNQGALNMLTRLQGGDHASGEQRQYYDDLAEQLRRTGGIPKPDESWRNAYDECDLAAYDFAVGEMYEGYGYPRQAVTEQARAQLQERYGPLETPEAAEKLIPPWRLDWERTASASKSWRDVLTNPDLVNRVTGFSKRLQSMLTRGS